MNNTVYGQGNKQGDVPVVYPSGGFGVDGDAFAGHPKLYVGDWYASQTPGSTGGSVFNSGGVLIPPPPKTEVAIFMDNFKTGDLNVFAESDKINDNPNTYDIKAGNVPPKDDMQRAIAVFTWGDPNLTTPNYSTNGVANDLWCLFAADRWEVNGSAYIDFEFNQNAIIVNPDGTVSTEAPLVDGDGDSTGGRTPGDILITIEFVRGGGVGNLYVDKWSKDGLGQAYYWKAVDLTLPEYASSIFVTHNTVAELAPWPIYDQVGPPYTYAIDQYAEGAINLTQIMGVDAKCGHFATVWTRTKSSHSSTAQLKDLGGITSLNVGAVPPVAICSTVNVPACTSEANMDKAFTDWKASFAKTPGTGTEPVIATFDPEPLASLPANAGCGYTFTTTYTLTDDCGKTDSCTGTFTIAAPAPAVIVDKPDVVLEGCNPAWPSVVSTTYTFCNVEGTINGVAGEVQSSQDGCTQYIDYTFNFTDPCLNQAVSQVTRVSRHYDMTAPVIVDKPDVVLEGCNPAWPTVVTTTYTDNCDAGGSINGVAGEVQSSQDGCTQYIDYTFNFTDSCSNPAAPQVTRVSRHYDMTAPEITCSANLTIACNSTPVFETPTATDNCTASNDIVIVPGEVVIVNNADGTVSHTMSWYAEDSCGNQSTSCSQVITVLSCNAHCTYTQGYYGNLGGMSCAGEGDTKSYTTTELIAKALGSYSGGTMTIGLPGQSVFMTAPDDIDDIIRVLPGGGGSYALLAGDIQISSSDFSSYLRKGNINNTLLAQTITLGLNLGIDSDLGDFVLQSGTLATAAPEGGCGF
ncbi:MAG: hypothetical protein Q7T74_07675, partial [Candidatus Saccharibacteria bacterium]|nr:hypothetical protein [Candidatus Saccharibacteria bacterium]